MMQTNCDEFGLSDTNNENEYISIYPDKSSGNVSIVINTTYGTDCDLVLNDLDGNVIFSRPFNFDAKRTFILHAGEISKGTYTVTVIDGEKRYNQKLTIE